ncbi:MAG: DUF481 domain-containing protein [Pseudomonadota bacterium]
MRTHIIAAVSLGMLVAASAHAQDDEAFLKSARAALASAEASGNAFVVQNVADAYISARPDLAEQVRSLYTEISGSDPTEAVLAVAAPDAAVAATVDESAEAPSVPAQPSGILQGWTGNVNFAFEVESGNTEETEINLAVDATKTIGKWESDYRLEHNFSRANTIRVEEEYLIRTDIRRDLGGKWSWAGFLNAERDLFSGFDYRIALGLGPSYQIIENENTKWRTSIGPGVRFDQLAQPGAEVTTTAILGVESEFRQNLWGNWSLGNDFNASFGNGQIINILTFLQTTLYKNLALRISQELDIETDAPVGAETTDTTNTLSIVYNFGGGS